MKRWLALLLPVLVLGGLITWRLNQKRAEAADQAKQMSARRAMVPSVAVATAVCKDIVQTFEAVGSVEAPLNVKIASKVSGRIDYLVVEEGAPVKRGQVLVRIDPSQIQADVSQKRAALAEAQSRLAQAAITQNPTVVSIRTNIRQQQAALTSAQADLRQATENYAAQQAAAASAVTDAEGRISNADAAIANAEASVGSAQANLENAQSRYNRIHDLYIQGFVAAQDVDDARTTVKVQQGALNVAKGQVRQASSTRASAVAQRDAAKNQLDIAVSKGRADIAAAKAKAQQAAAALDYAKANAAQKPAYQQNLAALRAAVDAAQADLRSSQAQRADTVLASPMDGFVTARTMDPGSMATPGQPILTLQAIRQVWVSIPVPEEDSHKIRMGEVGAVTFDAYPDQKFEGRVSQINTSADPSSRQFTVRLTLDNPKGQIKPGMFGHVSLETERATGVIAVPREALQKSREGGSQVVVVDSSGTVHLRPVTEGPSDPEYVSIASGLEAGEKVVTLSSAPLKDGAKVRFGGRGRGAPGGGGAEGRRGQRPGGPGGS